MSDELAARIATQLARAGQAMSGVELAEELGSNVDEIDAVLWDRTDRFAWQPGHRWVVVDEKSASVRQAGADEPDDSRPYPLVPVAARELRARTLSNGLVLRITTRPLDTLAFFQVRGRGQSIEIVLNTNHELFATGVLPFTERMDATARTLEVVLEAWALVEEGASSSTEKRLFEDLRSRWGERIAEVLAQ